MGNGFFYKYVTQINFFSMCIEIQGKIKYEWFQSYQMTPISQYFKEMQQMENKIIKKCEGVCIFTADECVMLLMTKIDD